MEPAGDVLCFLTGQDEIETACKTLDTKWRAERGFEPRGMQMLILSVFAGVLVFVCLLKKLFGVCCRPLYGAMPSELQHKIFAPPMPGVRKIIFCTKIAETSLTVPGIRYVIDAGFVKQKMFQPERGMDALLVVPISKTAAQQRAGRSGKCPWFVCGAVLLCEIAML